MIAGGGGHEHEFGLHGALERPEIFELIAEPVASEHPSPCHPRPPSSTHSTPCQCGGLRAEGLGWKLDMDRTE